MRVVLPTNMLVPLIYYVSRTFCFLGLFLPLPVLVAFLHDCHLELESVLNVVRILWNILGFYYNFTPEFSLPVKNLKVSIQSLAIIFLFQVPGSRGLISKATHRINRCVISFNLGDIPLLILSILI